MKRATFSRGPVVAGCLQIPVPAVQGSWQRGASNLETHPVTKRSTIGGYELDIERETNSKNEKKEEGSWQRQKKR